MPEHVHVVIWPKEPEYEMRLIRTALKVPVQRRGLKYLRTKAPAFLERLKDVEADGTIHHRFWQRGPGYDRNITEYSTLAQMIEYIHNNPVRRGLVEKATDWIWSSARYYSGDLNVPIRMDPLPILNS
jgi:putative transposase